MAALLNSVWEETAVVPKMLSSFLFPPENPGHVWHSTARWTVTISCVIQMCPIVSNEDEDERWRPTSEVEEFMVRYSSSYINYYFVDRKELLYDTIQE